VTVLFTDLVGFTTLAEDRDPETVRELLARYFNTATEVITLHGGTVEKFIGDAVMAVWGTPVAHEDDAERAVRAALQLVEAIKPIHPDLQARAGVLTGEAAVTLGATNQGMVAGDLVNTAARLQGVAEPGTVLVGEATMRAASGAIAFEPIGERTLKGKTSPVPAWQALRVVAARGGQGRTDVLEPPFVGRDEELRELKEALHAVGRERRLRLVSITGPGGIGKSRLVWELEKYVDGVTEEVWWHRGRSPSYGEGITFWALGEMVRRRAGLTEDDDQAMTRARIEETLREQVPDQADRERIGPALLSLLGVEPPPPGGRDALFPAWRTFFERIAERGTTVLVFEDLQWADTGLLDFIDHLLDWSKGLPLMIVTLARPELFERRPDFAAGRRHLTALALEPLPDEAMAELLGGLVPGLPEATVRAIVARAEGFPLYAVETVRALLADGRIARDGETYRPVGDLSQLAVPESLRSLIASRLDALDPEDRALIQDAAVLGQVFSADALGAVTGQDTADLDRRLRGMVRRELIQLETDPQSPERGQYRFVQSLIREVAYGTLARRDRRARHLSVARHFEALGDDELAGVLASHYLAARDASDPGPEADAVSVQARIALVAAAQRAGSLGAPQDALRYADQALALTTDPADRAPILDRAVSWATAAAVPSDLYGRQAIEAYRQLDDTLGVARASARLGKALIDNNELTRALEQLESALRDVEATGDEPLLAETLANVARIYMRTARAADAIAAADRALSIAERHNLEPIVAEALVNKGSALAQLGRRRESVALMELALQIAEANGDDSVAIRTRNNIASTISEDQPERAMSMLFESMELCRRVGDRGMYNWQAGFAAIMVAAAGEGWDQHLELLREAAASAELRPDRARLTALAGLFEIPRGERLREIRAELQELVGDSDNIDDRFGLRTTKAEIALVEGDYEASYRDATEVAAMLTQNAGYVTAIAARAATWMRDLDRAREVLKQTMELPFSGAYTNVQRMQAAAAVAALEGRVDEAVTGYREARSWLLAHGQRWADADLVVGAAILLPSHPEVRAWALEARPLLVELRAKPYLERLDAALAEGAAAPGASRATAPTVDSAVTPTV
jgi:class 3 adenylate cyclase/tetratricopeptide (TPR) repeat protein